MSNSLKKLVEKTIAKKAVKTSNSSKNNTKGAAKMKTKKSAAKLTSTVKKVKKAAKKTQVVEFTENYLNHDTEKALTVQVLEITHKKALIVKRDVTINSTEYKTQVMILDGATMLEVYEMIKQIYQIERSKSYEFAMKRAKKYYRQELNYILALTKNRSTYHIIEKNKR